MVSRGGRPDLAGVALGRVTAPTLLIVGALDPQVLELNRRAALGRLGSGASLEVVPGASHLFKEPGALEKVAELAAGWFIRWLASWRLSFHRRWSAWRAGRACAARSLC